MRSLDINFLSKGTRCAATLLMPDVGIAAPVIIMAHGFGLIRDAGLMLFAKRFVKAGYAVLMFDYRTFGDSDGLPRQWISPKRHIEDWHAAIAHVRTLHFIDSKRIALWGTSFSGGHALQVAAKDQAIHAVITLVPHVSGLASMRETSLSMALRLSLAGLQDLIGGLFGKPVYRPIIGQPGDVAALTSPGAWSGYLGLLPSQARWRNITRARIFLELPLYSPIRYVHRILVPVLVIAGRYDRVTPPDAAKSAATRMPKGQFFLLDSDHFQPFAGDHFEQGMSSQLAFLNEAMPITPPSHHHTGN